MFPFPIAPVASELDAGPSKAIDSAHPFNINKEVNRPNIFFILPLDAYT
tara:strand:- start:1261 stop:1407 length:147 start_codon:yes stop_codon:yes gene_type:complete